ncbi:fucose 4-O-acetylase-like acetyltransferase [Marmoricola sp. URHA0025 HA25]
MTTLRSGAVRPVEAGSEPAVAVAPAEVPRSEARARRDPWFDNIKMTLVTLVVVGHSWTLLPQDAWSSWTYDFLYAWHVPAFVTITGYLSRSFRWTPAKLWGLVQTVAVPYLIFEAVLAWFRYGVGGVELDQLFADPHWPMWYLSALFFWRLMTPAFLRMSAPAALAVAIAISLVAGLAAGNILDSARILGLLPFFVLGLTISEREWGWLRSRRAVLPALLGVAVVAVFTWRAQGWIPTEWYYYRSRYDVLESNNLDAVAIRSVLLCIGLIGTASCFALVPRSRSWFSTLGAATLVVYLFHGFFVLTAKYEGYPDWAAAHAVVAFLVTTLAAIALALLLAVPPVARTLGVLVDPIGWLDRRRRQVLGSASVS